MNNRLKKLCCIAVIAAMIMGMLPVFTFASDVDDSAKNVYFSTPAIFADEGETVTLSDYSVMFDASNTTAAESIVWTSEVLTVTDGKVTPAAKGVYSLTAAYGSQTKTVYLVVKAETDTEYVLYEMDFSSVGSLDELIELGYTVPEQDADHTVEVSDGKLKMSGAVDDGTTRVMLPYWLADFGDYSFEADIAMTAKQQSGRFFSLLFRVQNENTYRPYYVYTVRSNATASNGLELCYRNASNTWSGTVFKSSHTENVDDSKERSYTVSTLGSYEEGSINGNTVIKGNYKTSSYGTGGLGILIRGVSIEVSGVRVTLNKEDVEAINTNTVRYASPAVLADTDETVDLTDCNVMFSENVISSAEYITWSSSDITVTDGTVTPTKKGVYELTAAITSGVAGSFTKTVYLVVKDPLETEYVLFDFDYSSVSSVDELTELGFVIAEQPSTFGIEINENGNLAVSTTADDGSNARILLPTWLNDFGNYSISSDITMTSSKNDARYFAIMFRTQTLKNYYPIYVSTFRADPTTYNGVEFNYRRYLSSGSLGWGSAVMGPYTEKINDGVSRNYTVDVYANGVRNFVDGENVLSDSDYISAYADGLDAPTGGLGYLVRGCDVEIAYTRVTLKTEADSAMMADVEDPESDIILPATMVTCINSKTDFDKIVDAVSSDATAPATAVLRIDSDLNVVDTEKNVITTVEKAVGAFALTVIPAFYVTDSDTLDALTYYLKQSRLADLFVISNDAELVKTAREEYTLARGVLDLSAESLTEDDLFSIRERTNACGARICILPTELTNKANVEYLQRLFMTVWTKTASDTPVGIVKAITSGANGIITQDVTQLAESYTEYFDSKTAVRTTGVIAHQGVYYLAQPNTVSGSQLAYELGATAIENDIHLTKDGVIVAMHNTTIDSATNGTGAIADMTFEELRQYSVDSTSGVDPAPIAALYEYFEAFKGLDVQLIVEIKSSDPAIIDELVRLIKEYDIADQVNVISFQTAQLLRLKELMPEISVGYLTGNISADEAAPENTLYNVLGYVQKYDSTYNPSYTAGPLGINTVTAASHRGVTIWPYTINSKAELTKYLFCGVGAITTNNTNYFSDCIKSVSTDSDSYVSESTEIPVTVNTLTYDRTEGTSSDATLKFIDGDDIFTYENGKIKASGEGSATLMFSLTVSAPSSETYNIVTEPFTVTVKEPEAITGTAGPNAAYSFDTATGVLTIEGTGEVWKGVDAEYKDQVKEVVIGEGITTLTDCLFCDYYTSLEKITLPSTLTTIGNWAFFGTALTEIALPEALTSVGDYAFYGVALEDVTYAGTRAKWDYVTIGTNNEALNIVVCDGEISEAITETAQWTFDGVDTLYIAGTGYYTADKNMIPNDMAENIKHIVIDNTIAGFGAYSFTNLTNLETVTGGENMRYLGIWAFSGLTKLTTVEFTSSELFGVLGYGAFSGCSSLNNVTLSDSLKVIGGAAFKNCTSLTSIVIPENITTVAHRMFEGCTALETVEIKGAAELENDVFYGCTSLKSVTLPEGLTTIGAWCFAGAKIDALTLPETLTTVGDYAFYWTTLGTVNYTGDISTVTVGIENSRLTDKI